MSQESTAGPAVPHHHIVAYMKLLLDWSKGVARHHDRQDLENDTGIDFLSSYSCYVKWLVQVNVRFSACIQTLGRKVVHAQGHPDNLKFRGGTASSSQMAQTNDPSLSHGVASANHCRALKAALDVCLATAGFLGYATQIVATKAAAFLVAGGACP